MSTGSLDQVIGAQQDRLWNRQSQLLGGSPRGRIGADDRSVANERTRYRRSAASMTAIALKPAVVRDLSIPCNRAATEHQAPQLAIVRRPNADVFGADLRQHILGKAHQHHHGGSADTFSRGGEP